MTVHVIWIDKYRLDWFRPKVTSSELIKIQKVISPNFNSRVAIFNSISRVNWSDYRVFVISESHRIFEVREISREWNSKSNNFISSSWWRVLTLKASVVLSDSSCFSITKSCWFSRTLDICCINNQIISSKLTFWIWKSWLKWS